MLRRLASVALVPMKKGQDQVVNLVDDTIVLGVGYAGGASVQLLLEVPVLETGRPVDMVERSFRLFVIGDEIPDHYRFLGHVKVGPSAAFVYERVKP